MHARAAKISEARSFERVVIVPNYLAFVAILGLFAVLKTPSFEQDNRVSCSPEL
jgi:hypothetical protein